MITRTQPGDWLFATAAVHRLRVAARALSRSTQEGKLQDLREAGGAGVAVYTDSGSGLPDRRPGVPPAPDECMKPGVAEDETWEQELVRDILTIVASFSGRLSGQRSAEAGQLSIVVVGDAGRDAA